MLCSFVKPAGNKAYRKIWTEINGRRTGRDLLQCTEWTEKRVKMLWKVSSSFLNAGAKWLSVFHENSLCKLYGNTQPLFSGTVDTCNRRWWPCRHLNPDTGLLTQPQFCEVPFQSFSLVNLGHKLIYLPKFNSAVCFFLLFHNVVSPRNLTYLWIRQYVYVLLY